jgi:diguanylate cyclase (GGDEF)-like protein/PAS domain S-box-containing protein
LVRFDTAQIVPSLREGLKPRDMLGRVQLLLLAVALLNAAWALVVVLASNPQPPVLYAAGVVSPFVLAWVWISAYRHRNYGAVGDAASIAAICLVTMAAANPWFNEIGALLTGAAFFGAAFGSLPRVLFRTGLVAAVALGEGVDAPTTLTLAVLFTVALVVLACLVHGMASSMDRYERTSRRERILAATGLDLVAACDMPSVVASAIESARALCAELPGIRVSLATPEGPDTPAVHLRVLGSAGHGSSDMDGALIEIARLAPAGHELADQRLFFRAVSHVLGSAEPDEEPRFLFGEILATRLTVAGAARGVLLVESPSPISNDLPAAIRALATQVSLAISRMDLQTVVARRESTERFQALIQSSTDVIAIVSPDGICRYVSPSVHQVFGTDPEEMLGRPADMLVHPDDKTKMKLDFDLVLSQPGSTRTGECRISHADGSWRHAETRMTNQVHVPAIDGVVLNTRDVTDRHTLEAELRHQAFHDSLTGLSNRVLFADRVEHALVSAKRDGSIVAVLYCDLEGMKRVNDSLGHSAGDTALITVAERLGTCVRGQDTVGRLSGNEFGILLQRLSSPADATQAMERVMSTLRHPIALPGAQVELQPHIGIAVSIGGGESAEDLLRNGAVAMHQARVYEGGYALFDPEMHTDAIRRIEVESQLRTALDEQQFILHYQPTIDLLTGRLTGVEALVRWQHPHRGIVPPMEFIPLAEESGLIVPLGQWTIQEACRQVRVWQKEIPADEPISLNVNLSGRQLRHPNLVRDVADALDDSGLLPSRLVLEITESVLMNDTAATLNRLFQLKSIGVRLAVDDFGTGYSSFAYLRRFPVDILKIDKSFVDGIATEPTASALVDAMIRIGKTLNLETVAEGVERNDQADRLRHLQCDIGQGYLWSRPVPSDQLTAMLRERAAAGRRQADAA